MNRGPKTSAEILEGGLVGKVLRHGSAYFLGSGLLMATGLFLLPVNTRLFSRSDYGAIATVNAANGLLAVFVGLQLHAAYLRFYVDHRDDRAALRRYTSTLWWSTVGLALPSIPAALLIARALPVPGRVLAVLPVAFVAPALHQLARLATVHLQQNHRAGLQRALALACVLVHAGVMVALVTGFGLGLMGKFVGVTVGALALAAASGIVLCRDGLLGFELSGRLLRSSLAYSIPLLPGLAAAWVTSLSDRLLLARLDSFTAAGVYNAGYLLGRVVALLGQAMLLAYYPVLLAKLSADREGAREDLARFLPPFVLVTGWAAVAVALLAGEILLVLAPAGYGAAAAVVPVVVAAHALRAVASLFHYVLVFAKRTAVLGAGLALEALVNLALNLLLIPRYGMIAAAWTTLAAIAFHALWIALWTRRTLPIRLEAALLARTVAVLAATAALGALAGHALAGRPGAAAAAKGLVLALSLPAAWWATAGISRSRGS